MSPTLDDDGALRLVAVAGCTPVGLRAAEAAAAVRAGISAFATHPFVIDSSGDKVTVARVPFRADSHDVRRRIVALALAAFEEVSEAANLERLNTRIPIYIAMPSPRPGLTLDDIESVAEEIATKLPKYDAVSSFSMVHGGHAAGLLAIDLGCQRLRDGESDLVLVGGVDSWLDADTLEWLEAEERLHTAENPWGFVPGEGAGFCLISASRRVPKVGLARSLEVSACSSTKEAVPRRGSEPCLGRGLTSAIENVLESLPKPELIHEVLCDYNGESDRADEYGFAAVRIGDRCVDATATRTPADCWGDVGAATGTLLVTLAVQAAERSWLRGSNVLIWSSSDGPERAALLLRASSGGT